MLDYNGEEDFYPMDGDWDNYSEYTPEDYYQKTARSCRSGNQKDFLYDPYFYDRWIPFVRIIEREKCYSILRNDIWMNIPKKIVRQIKDNQMLVHIDTLPNPIIDSEGNKRWFNVQGRLHRIDGPAVELANGSKAWWLNDKLHREDGPAIEWANGTNEWWLHGKQYTEEEFALLQFVKGINIYA